MEHFTLSVVEEYVKNSKLLPFNFAQHKSRSTFQKDISYATLFIRWLMLVCILIFLFSCSDKPSKPDKTPIALEITASSFSTYSGGNLQLTTIASFADGTTGDVTKDAQWSNLPGYAGTVDNIGLFTAVTDLTGTETVRADYHGQSASAQIEVSKRARSLLVRPATTTIESGQRVLFEASVEYQDASLAYVTDKVQWTITPGDIATIDSSGLFLSLDGKYGREVVSANYQDLMAQAEVLVQKSIEIPFDMTTIPEGSYTMGDDDGSSNEKPAHEVFIGAFEIGTYEVTNEQYVAYLNSALAAGEILVESGIVSGRKGPFAWLVYFRFIGSPEFPDLFIEYVEGDGGDFEFRVKPGFEKYPVVRLNWYGAAAFCSYYGLRLPTEAEWEKACRGGQRLEYGTQDGSISHDLANYVGVGGNDGFDGLAPVGSFAPNPYGLYDMSGNSGEYVFDLYDQSYYQNSPTENPTGPGPAKPLGRLPGRLVLWRGGSWITQSKSCRSAFRGIFPDQADHNYLNQSFVGFRVAR